MISSTALDVLRRSNAFSDRVVLPPGALDRDIYVELNKVLEALGGKWNRVKRAHVFTKDPRSGLTGLLGGGSVEVERVVTKKKTLQAFYTPAKIADDYWVTIAADLLAFSPLRFLEPSAGDGAIVRAITRRYPVDVSITSVEIDASLDFVSSFPGVDFLTMPPRALSPFHAVIINPHFAIGQDIAHVTHSWKFVRPGGVLVAIVSPAYSFREGKRWEEFRHLDGLHNRLTRDLPAGAFKESGTNVTTTILGWVK